MEGCPGHHLVTQTDGFQDVAQTDWLASLAPRARVAPQTTSHEAALNATIEGAGLASLVRFRADAHAGLVRMPAPSLPTDIPSSGIWLVVHKDNRDTPRIRVTLDHIAKWVRRLRDRLDPADVRMTEGGTAPHVASTVADVEAGARPCDAPTFGADGHRAAI